MATDELEIEVVGDGSCGGDDMPYLYILPFVMAQRAFVQCP